METVAATRSRVGQLGWMVVLAVGALLTVYGVMWFFVGPDMALTNIAERTTLAPDDFRQGSPSAFDVITIVTRQGAAFGAAMGVLALFVGWQGYRAGASWAWWASWAPALGIAASGLGFLAPGAVAQASFYLGLAAIIAIALVAARR